MLNITETLQYGTDADCRIVLDQLDDVLEDDTVDDLRDQIETLKKERDANKLHWWSSGSGRIELQITLADARDGSHPGPCDATIASLRKQFYIRAQLAYLCPDDVRAELAEYGAWDDEELVDNDVNLSRLLWIVCGNIIEEVEY